MRQDLGIFVVVAGWLLAAYVGFYLMLFMGIMDALNGLDQSPIDKPLVVWGIIKALFCGLATIIGWAGTFIGLAIGYER